MRDIYHKEPLGMLIRALVAGAIITIPIIGIELWLSAYVSFFTGLQAAAYNAFVVAAVTEELFKFLALYILVWRSKAFDEQFDGIVYAVFISLGFAMVENIMYVFRFGDQTAYARAFTAVPAHALFGITMGYYFSLSKFFTKRRSINFISALAMPILLHGVYDFILMSRHPLYFVVFLPFLFYLWRSGFKKMKLLSGR